MQSEALHIFIFLHYSEVTALEEKLKTLKMYVNAYCISICDLIHFREHDELKKEADDFDKYILYDAFTQHGCMLLLLL